MHPTKALFISLLPALSMAISYRRKGSSQTQLGASKVQNTNAGNAPGINDCGDSTFIGLSQNPGNNPTVDDCQKLIDTIRRDQWWPVTSVSTVIVQYGTCAFGVKTAAGTSPELTAAIGDSDVVDLVTDSIKKYGTNGRVGCHGGYKMYVAAAGAMGCDSPDLASGQQVGVDWTLSHS